MQPLFSRIIDRNPQDRSTVVTEIDKKGFHSMEQETGLIREPDFAVYRDLIYLYMVDDIVAFAIRTTDLIYWRHIIIFF